MVAGIKSESPAGLNRNSQSLTAVIQEAYIQCVSSRSVDDLLKAMGMTAIPAVAT